jgi:hypothetical protein
MATTIALVIPEAPAPLRAVVETQRNFEAGGIRLGILDNSKANADHLLARLVEGVKAAVAVTSIVSLRKPSAALAAPAPVLDRLAREADFVVGAMAD